MVRRGSNRRPRFDATFAELTITANSNGRLRSISFPRFPSHPVRTKGDESRSKMPVVRDRVNSPFRTLVVDNFAFLLERLCRLLDAQPMIQLVGTARQGLEALYLAEVLQPDLVLMALDMPLVDGVHAAEMLRRRHRHMLVIIMSIDGSPEAHASARAHGAHGFVWQPRIHVDLMTEIHRAYYEPP